MFFPRGVCVMFERLVFVAVDKASNSFARSHFSICWDFLDVIGMAYGRSSCGGVAPGFACLVLRMCHSSLQKLASDATRENVSLRGPFLICICAKLP